MFKVLMSPPANCSGAAVDMSKSPQWKTVDFFGDLTF